MRAYVCFEGVEKINMKFKKFTYNKYIQTLISLHAFCNVCAFTMLSSVRFCPRKIMGDYFPLHMESGLGANIDKNLTSVVALRTSVWYICATVDLR